MAMVLVLRSESGEIRKIEVNAGDVVVLQAGEVVDSIEGVELSQVSIRFEGSTLFIGWPEGSVSVSGYAERPTEEGSGSAREVAAGPVAAPLVEGSALQSLPLADGSDQLANATTRNGLVDDLSGDGRGGAAAGEGENAESRSSGLSDVDTLPSGLSGQTQTQTQTQPQPQPQPQPSVFTVSAAGISEGGVIAFVVTRSGDVNAAVAVDFATTPGSASPGDFAAAAGTLSFAAGEISKVVNVSTIQDTPFELGETFTIQLRNPSGGAVIQAGGGVATGTIIDDDPVPLFSISAPADTTEGGSLTFTITRSNTDVEPVQGVSFQLGAGSETSASDFSNATSGTLTFLPGEASKTFTVVNAPDTLFELDEVAQFQLLDPTGGAGLGTATASATVFDDDPDTVISIAPGSAVEGDSMIFTLTRLNDAEGVQTVDFAAVNAAGAPGAGFALEGVDFPALTGTAVFNPGQTTTTVVVPPSLPEDTLQEGNETFALTLSNPGGGATLAGGGATLSAIGTIVDDDIASFIVADTTDPTVTEGGVIEFTVSRTLDPGLTQSVNLQLVDGTATLAGMDYSTIGVPFLVTLNPGELSTQVMVTATGDTKFEGDETFSLQLLDGGGLNGAVIGIASATGTIRNDDAAPQFTIVPAPGTANEGDPGAAGGMVFTVTRNVDAQPTQTVDVATLLSGDTATPGDFVAISQTLTFTDGGGNSQAVIVNAVSDQVFELDETFSVQISNPTGGALINGTVTDTIAVQGQISNDDAAPTFTVADASALEGNGGVVFTVLRAGSSEVEQTVNYAVSIEPGDTAQADDLVMPLPTGILIFAAGETFKTVPVPTEDDALFEADQTFTFTLSNNSLDMAAPAVTATGTITNDDAPPGVAVADAFLDEGDAGTSMMSFTITRTGNAQLSQDITATASIGGNAKDTDFDDTASTTFNFAPGESIKTFNVAVNGDTLFESDETFAVTLSGETNGLVVTDGTAVGTINNDDAAPTVSIDDVAVDEEDGSITFTVTRDGDAEADQSVTVTTALDGVGANPAESTDFDAASLTPATLTFSEGGLPSQTQTVQITVNDDAVFEENETFLVNLGSATGGLDIIGGDGQGIGTIRNVADVAPSFAIDSVQAQEGNQLLFTVTRSGDAEADQTVDYSIDVIGGTAEAADLVTPPATLPITGTLTFSEGESAQTITVDSVADTVFEADESFEVTLSNASLAGAMITTPVGTGTIQNDEAVPQFVISAAPANEGSPVTFTVTMSNAAEDTQTVDFATADTGAGIGFAADGTDYVANSGTLTFLPGETTQSFTVTTLQDGLQEGTEIFDATISMPMPGPGVGAIIGTATASANIIDDDIPTYSVADGSAAEGDGLPIQFVVSRDQPSSFAQTVDYTVTIEAGDSAELTDFMSAPQLSGTLSFAVGGADFQNISLDLVNDFLFEGAETFTVTLSNAQGGFGANIGTGGVATGTIMDDENAPVVSIADGSDMEDAAGGVGFGLSLTLDTGVALENAVTVDVATSLGGVGALADATDFPAGVLPGAVTATFAAGSMTMMQTASVPVFDDGVFEADETFTVTLGNETGGLQIGTGTATGTIENDELGPEFSITATASSAESSGIVFTVSRTGVADVAQSVDLVVDFQPAVDALVEAEEVDLQAITFGAVAQTLTWNAGDTADQMFTVNTMQDTLFEPDETFTVSLSDGGALAGAQISTGAGSGVGTIVNEDMAPTFAILAVPPPAGPEGGTVSFTVERTGNAEQDQNVTWSTIPQTGAAAAEGTDFTPVMDSVLLFTATGAATQSAVVNIVGDELFEVDETFEVQLIGTDVGSVDGTPVQGTIIDDENAPVVSIAPGAGFEIADGTVDFTLMLSTDAGVTLDDALTVEVALTDGTAQAADFPGGVLPGPLLATFAAGSGNGDPATVSVPVVADGVFEDNETFTASLQNPSGGLQIAAGAGGSATGTISNDDAAPQFSIAVAAAPVDEGGDIVFTVTRSGVADRAQSVTLTTSSSGGLVGADAVDFVGDALPGSVVLTWAAGAAEPASQTFTVNTKQDAVYEPDEMFTVTLGSETGGAEINLGAMSADGTIVNEDMAPDFSVMAEQVTEGDPPAAGGRFTFTVTRTGDAEAVQDITIETADVMAANAATAGVDYVALLPTTLSFGPGVATQSVTVDAIADMDAEGNEVFNVTLSNPTNEATAMVPTVQGTIFDDDIPLFSIAPSSATEGNPPTGGMVEFTVSRDRDTPGVTQTVEFATSIEAGDSAEGMGVDLSAATGMLSFAPGIFSQTFTVALTADLIFEGNETFTATISAPAGGFEGPGANIGVGSAQGTIIDDEAVPTVSIVSAGADEGTPPAGGGVISFTVNRSSASEQAQTVDYTTVLRAGADAAEAEDFVAAMGTITFAPNETTKTVTVDLEADDTFELDELFDVVLSNPGPGLQIAAGTATGIVRNDEAPPAISIAGVSATEGGDLLFNVMMSRPAEAPQSVSFATSIETGDSAGTDDFTAAAGTVIFAPGQTSQTITVSSTVDSVFETNETFTVTLSAPVGGATLGAATATGTIADDDGAPTFAIIDATGIENGAVTFTITRTGNAEAAQTIEFRTLAVDSGAGDTAETVDFTAVAPTTVTFNNGEMSKTVDVTTIDDGVFEGAETFRAEIANPNFGTVTTGTAVGTINDDEASPQVNISFNAGLSTTEGTPPGAPGSLVFDVTRTSLSESSQSVDYNVGIASGDTAEADDFDATPGTVTFLPNELTKTITVTTSADAVFEDAETFSVILLNPQGGLVLGGTSLLVATIQNDDAPPEFSIVGQQATEGGDIVFTVSRSGDADRDQSVTLVTSSSGGLAGAEAEDFLGGAFPADTPLTWTPGDTADKTFTVRTVADGVFEPDEVFTVTLTDVGGQLDGATISAVNGNADGTINDSGPIPAFTVTAIAGNEGDPPGPGGTVSFQVALSGPAEGVQTVDVATADAASALAGTDYTALALTTLSFDPGDGPKTVNVSILADDVAEGNETFNLLLSNESGGATIATPSVVGTITDDDIPTYNIADGSGTEGGMVTLQIARDQRAEDPQTVNYQVSVEAGDSAEAGDFLPSAPFSGSVVFGTTDDFMDITINTQDDMRYEGTETFTVTLSSVTGGPGATIGDGVATGTITDDENAPVVSIADGSDMEDAAGGVGFGLSLTLDTGVTLENAVTVDVATSLGGVGALADVADFPAGVLPGAVTATFAAGSASTMQTVSVPVFDDGVFEADETFTVTLDNETGGLQIGTGTATGTIENDESQPVFSITATASSAEGSGVVFTVSRTGVADVAQSVNLVVDFQPAVDALVEAEEVDLQAITFGAVAQTLTWNAGDTADQMFTVNTMQDTLFEPDETFTVSLSDGGALAGARISTGADSGVGTIVNEDMAPTFAILAVPPAAGPEGGTVSFTVERTGNAEQDQNVTWSTLTPMGVGAAEGTDFTPVMDSVLLFTATGAATQSAVVNVVDDALFEVDETFEVQLIGTDVGSVDGTAVQGTIIDDENAPVVSIAPGAGFEIADGTVDFTLMLSTDLGVTLDDDLTVEVALTLNGTAQAADFPGGVLPGPLLATFAAGSGNGTSVPVTVPVVADGVFEDNETFTASLQNASGGLQIAGGAGGSVTGTIINDDAAPQFSIAVAAAPVDEGGDIVFTVTRTGVADVAQSVTLTTSSSGGLVGADAVDFVGDALPGSVVLTWAAGAAEPASQTFTVNTKQDAVYEPDEVFTVTLGNETGGAQISTGSAVGTIVNEDMAPSFAIAPASALEGDLTPPAAPGTLTFFVTRTGLSEQDQSVNYHTADQTPAGVGKAEDGIDYVGTSDTLTFSASELTKSFTVAPLADDSAEGDEVFDAIIDIVGQPFGSIAVGTTTGTVRDDDIPIYSINDAIAAENGGSITFTVSRDSGAAVDQTIDYTVLVQGGDSAEDGDLTPALPITGTLTFAATADPAPPTLTQTITVNINNDALFEVDETFSVLLSEPAGGFEGPGASIGDGLGKGTISNDDAMPTVRIDDEVVDEEAGTIAFTISRMGDAEASQSITATTALDSGGASPAEVGDFTAKTETFTFTTGQVSKTFTVTIDDDTVFEPSETFLVNLSGASAGLVVSDAQAVGRIDNGTDTAPTLSINDVSATEGGDLVFTVSRTGNAEQAQTVNYTTQLVGGGATSDDFTLPLPITGTLTFTAGQSSKFITVPTGNDAVFENDEIFEVTLSAENLGGVITKGTGVGTILNNDGEPSFALTAGSGDEGDGMNGSLVFTVTRSGVAEQDQTVEFVTLVPSGAAGDSAQTNDFTAVGTTTLTFTATGPSAQTVTVQLLGDTLFEGDETFRGQLQNASPGSSITTAIASATITNDDAMPTVRIDDAVVNEEDGTIDFTITRSGDAELSQSITATTALDSGGASPAEAGDFIAKTETFTFDIGQSEKTFTVTLNDETDFEPNETFLVNLSGESNDLVISDGQAVGRIDNAADTPPTLSIADASVVEGTPGAAGVLSFTITRVGDAEQDQVVMFQTSLDVGPLAAKADDFMAISGGSVTFLPGEQTKTVLVNAIADTLFEGNETFLVTLTGDSLGAVITDATAIGTINNDDAAPIFTITQAEGPEGGDIVFTIDRDRDAEVVQKVNFTTSIAAGDTAVAGDLASLPAGTLTFNPTDTQMTVTVTSTQDGIGEGDETFTVTLSDGGELAGAVIGTASAQGTIKDDDVPVYTITDAQALEGVGIVFTVSRSLAFPGTQTIDYATSPATGTSAAELADYTPTSGTLSFGATDLDQTFTVLTSPDTVFEGNEIFNVTLDNLVGFGSIGAGTAVGTIQEDDQAPVYSISATTNNVSEGGPITFRVTRDRGSELSQTISFAAAVLAGDTAEAVDFAPASGILTFDPSDTVKTFTVNTTADTLFEANETFTATISSPSAGTIGNSSVQGFIDNDDAAPTFGIINKSATEGSGITFTITRTGDAEANQVVNFATSVSAGDTATSGVDFTAIPSGSVTFLQGQTSKTFTVTTLQDTSDEIDETFTVTLSGAASGTATGTINDDDSGGGGPTVTVNLSSIDGSNGFILRGKSGVSELLGLAVSKAGDVNGDGLADVVVGAPFAQQDASTAAGRAYVVFGTTDGALRHDLQPNTLDGASAGFFINGDVTQTNGARAVGGGGDVNGDGLADVLMGTPGAALFDVGEGSVIFGRLDSDGGDGTAQTGGFDTLNGTVYSSFDPTSGSFPANGGVRLLASGAAGVSDGRLGSSIADAGDFNGDGISDVIVSAPATDLATRNNTGQVHVVFGQDGGFSANLTMDSAGLSLSTGFNMSGGAAGDVVGSSVRGAGDVDGDGFDDFLVGAGAVNAGAGQVYLVFGTASGFPDEVSLTALNGTNGIVFNGVDANGSLGGAGPTNKVAVTVNAAGDLNGDGLADFVMVAPAADPNSDLHRPGRAYVVFGNDTRSNLNVNLDGLDGTNGFMIQGGDIRPGGLFGTSFVFSGPMSASAAGDFDGDGFDDLLIGVPQTVDPDGFGGQAYVVYGKSGSFAGVNGSLLTDLNGTTGLKIANDGAAIAQFGDSVSGAGDVNGDGFDDVIVGASATSGGSGIAVVVFGGDFREQVSGNGNVFSGTVNDDVIDASAQANAVVHAGAGNDQITASAGFQRLDGGSGTDRFTLSGGGSINLGTLGERIGGFEEIDLNGDSGSLTTSITDVLDLGNAINLPDQLRVFGDATNVLNLENTATHTWMMDVGASVGVTDVYVAALPASAPNLRLEVDDNVPVFFV